MWSFTIQPGFATTLIDFTNALFPLIVGLMGLTALSAGIITFAALRYYLSEKAQPTVGTMPVTDYKEAA